MQGWFDKLTTNGEGADAVVVVRRPTTNAVDFRPVRPCILNMDVIDRFVLGLEDRGSAGSSRPANSEPEQLNGPYEPELGKVGPELGESR